MPALSFPVCGRQKVAAAGLSSGKCLAGAKETQVAVFFYFSHSAAVGTGEVALAVSKTTREGQQGRKSPAPCVPGLAFTTSGALRIQFPARGRCTAASALQAQTSLLP
jgi:hypothetical protein